MAASMLVAITLDHRTTTTTPPPPPPATTTTTMAIKLQISQTITNLTITNIIVKQSTTPTRPIQCSIWAVLKNKLVRPHPPEPTPVVVVTILSVAITQPLAITGHAQITKRIWRQQISARGAKGHILHQNNCKT